MEGGVCGGLCHGGVETSVGGVNGGSMLVVMVGGASGGLFLFLINEAIIDSTIKIRITIPPQIPMVLKSNFAEFSVTISVGSGLFCGVADGEAVDLVKTTISGVGLTFDLGVDLMVGLTVALQAPQVKLVGQSGFLQYPL